MPTCGPQTKRSRPSSAVSAPGISASSWSRGGRSPSGDPGAKLSGEWAAAGDCFLGVDFGMKIKMTAVLFLVARQSVYRRPGDFSERLSNSDTRRNHIIHRGEAATADGARQAIAVARRVVEI